jgi:hypothetical protein
MFKDKALGKISGIKWAKTAGEWTKNWTLYIFIISDPRYNS